jgi:hypothetical protein
MDQQWFILTRRVAVLSGFFAAIGFPKPVGHERRKGVNVGPQYL